MFECICNDGKRFLLRVFMLFFILLLLSSVESNGEEIKQAPIDTLTPQKISLTAGRSFIIESPLPVKRVSIANPEIADANVLTPTQVYLTGKSIGVTSLTLWSDSTLRSVFDLEVSPDTSRLKEKLREIFPGENDIRVSATHDSIALTGSVSGASNLSQILALSGAYAPGKVINMLEVRGVHQVMLEVKVGEISRQVAKRLGFNFDFISSTGSNLGLTMLDNLVQLPEDGWPANSLNVSDPVNALFRFTADGATWDVFIAALKENGLIKILAEPTLIALSGQSAEFLAGGEFPIPIPQDFGRVTIDFKEFGVALKFTPTVLSSNKISMNIAPEVSELDFTNAVSLSGFLIPSITTRRVNTTVELGDGQSFAIAGLLKDDVREVVSKFP
ncbi:MAG: type II and III secretion system protein family protein, partial [Nitrospirae bacterium]|nr:type II and III secretion system protein family protein [Nitrospirota bacterium]